MAKAGPVPGIKPKAPLRDNGRRMLIARLDDLVSWRHALDDGDNVDALHDMRIAAKRLRYALEMFEPCFDGVRPLMKRLTEMQESLGTIHDLDVYIALLRSRLGRRDKDLELAAADIMAKDAGNLDKSNELRRLLFAHARDRETLGLMGLLGDKMHERRSQYETFRATWGGGELDAFALAVRAAVRPDTTEAESQPEVMGQ